MDYKKTLTVNAKTFHIQDEFAQKAFGSLEETSVASKAYAVGELLMFDGTLYKVTDAINLGATLTPGTNIKATSVSEEVGGIVTGTLKAGDTSITISNSRIKENSVIDPYTSVYGVNPAAISVVDGSVTLTFETQANDVVVGVRIGGEI